MRELAYRGARHHKLHYYTSCKSVVDMGNRLIFPNVEQYQGFEGGLFGGLVVLFFIVFVLALICISCIKGICTDRVADVLHKILAAGVFPGLVTVTDGGQVAIDIDEKRKHKSSGQEHTEQVAINIDGEGNKSTGQELSNHTNGNELLLFGGKEIDHSFNDCPSCCSTGIEKCFKDRCCSTDDRCTTDCCTKKCATCYIYYYFITIGILASIWFFLLSVNSIVYRKTSTCNDINVLENSFVCYHIDNNYAKINCTKEVLEDRNTRVFCYLYSISPGAIGIAYSSASLVIYVVTIYFKVSVKIAELKCKCGAEKKQMCHIGMILVILAQISIFVGFLLLAILTIPEHFKWGGELYFFHGLAVLRVAMYPLTVITGIIIIPVPWCYFTKKKYYTTKVHFVDKEKEETSDSSVTAKAPNGAGDSSDNAVSISSDTTAEPTRESSDTTDLVKPTGDFSGTTDPTDDSNPTTDTAITVDNINPNDSIVFSNPVTGTDHKANVTQEVQISEGADL